MKKVSTVGAQASRKAAQKLTVGLDLGDRSSWYCVLDEAGTVLREQKLSTTAKALAGSVRGHAAQPHRVGNRDPLALDQPGAGRVGARSDRGQCPQAAVDWGKVARRTIGWMRRHWHGWPASIPRC
jgi:hypothetical protein